MVQKQSCPTQSVIQGFVSGNLEESQIVSLEHHLASCTRCGDTVRNLNASDTFVELVRTSAAGTPTPSEIDDARLDSLYQKLDELVDSKSPVVSASDADLWNRAIEVEVRFEPAIEADELGRLRNYRILKRLGAGGMGVVYQAEDTSLKRLVVLKILRPSLGEAARERFLQEARAAAAIEHECVVTIYQVDDENQLAFLAMQWLDGETLEDRLQRPPVLSTDEVVRISSQIASGLAAAHDKHLIHRDIKPANIWLEANQPRIRLLDFGLARAMDNNPQLTETGMLAGTPAYMSPEQARGEAVDERSDLFSLGTVMYRMLTGELPFACSNALAAIRSIQTDQPESPKQRNSSVPTFLSDTVMDLLEKDVRLRPTDAHSVAECLSRSQRPPRPTSVEASVRTQAKQSGNGRGIGKMVALAMAFLGLAAAPFLYRLSTDFGEITVESFDPNIQVQVLQGGREVAVLDVETNDSITLRSGEYDLQLKNASSQVSLQSNQLTLIRGAKEIVKIMRKSDSQLAGNTAPQATSDPLAANDSDVRLYEGKTLSDWLSVIKVERSPERLAAALQAIGTLATREDSQTVCKACFALAKETNAVSFIPALRSVDPKVLVSFLEREVRQGSPPHLLASVLNDAIWNEKELARELMPALPNILPMLARLTGFKDTRTQRLAFDCLYRLPERLTFDPITMQTMVSIYEDLIKRQIPYQWLSQEQLRLARRLAELSPDSKVLLDTLVRSLSSRFETKNLGDVRELKIFEQLGNRSVPALVQVLEKSPKVEDEDGELCVVHMLMLLAKLSPDDALPFVRSYRSSSNKRLGYESVMLFQQIGPREEVKALFAPEPTTYNDKTYNEWLSVLKKERSPEKLAEALTAIIALSTKQNSATTCEAIFEIARMNSNTFVRIKEFWELVSAIDMEVLADAIVNEFAVGNENSVTLVAEIIPPGRMGNAPYFIQAIEQRLEEALKIVDQHPMEPPRFQMFREGTASWLPVASDESKQIIVKWIEEKLAKDPMAEDGSLSRRLVALKPGSELLVDCQLNHLTNYITSNDVTADIRGAFYNLANSKHPRAVEGIPLAVKILEQHLADKTENSSIAPEVFDAIIQFLKAFPHEAQSALPLLRQYAKPPISPQIPGMRQTVIDSQIRGMAQTAIDSLTRQTGNDNDETPPDSNVDNDNLGDNAQE
ncbi:MAG: serine/threonine-protein kinase [Pirellulaceae bacterium]